MNSKEIIKEITTKRGWSQSKLAQEAGFKRQSNITGILNRGNNDMRVDQLVRLANALGCEVVVRDKFSNAEWTVSIDDKEVDS